MKEFFNLMTVCADADAGKQNSAAAIHALRNMRPPCRPRPLRSARGQLPARLDAVPYGIIFLVGFNQRVKYFVWNYILTAAAEPAAARSPSPGTVQAPSGIAT